MNGFFYNKMKQGVLSFLSLLPLVFAVILLISIMKSYLSPGFYRTVFTGNMVLDSFLGDIFGSIAIGNPITSYILGGEFLKEGISLAAILAFIIAWVTVGLLQLPMEASIFGRKFALIRNGVSFLLVIIISWLVLLIYYVLGG